MFAEGGRIPKSAGIRNLGGGKVGLPQKAGGVFQPIADQVFLRGGPHVSDEQFEQIGSVQTYVAGDIFDFNAAGEIVVDIIQY